MFDLPWGKQLEQVDEWKYYQSQRILKESVECEWMGCEYVNMCEDACRFSVDIYRELRAVFDGHKIPVLQYRLYTLRTLCIRDKVCPRICNSAWICAIICLRARVWQILKASKSVYHDTHMTITLLENQLQLVRPQNHHLYTTNDRCNIHIHLYLNYRSFGNYLSIC